MTSQNNLNNNVGSEEWCFETDLWVTTPPLVVDGTIYLGTAENKLYAVDTATGTEEWTFKIAVDGQIEELTVVDGTAYVVSNPREPGEYHLYAVNTATGTEEWTFESEWRITTSPSVVDDTVYFGTTTSVNDDSLYAVDTATGTEVWAFATQGDITCLTVVDGTAYVGIDNIATHEDTFLYAVDAATGAELWAIEAGGGLDNIAVVDGTVYFSATDNRLHAVDAATGTKEWTFETGGSVYHAATVVNGMVYVSVNDNNKLYAVNAATGTEEWTFEVNGSLSLPIVVDGIVYFGGEENLYAVDTATGAEEWTFKIGGMRPPSLTVADGTVYSGKENLYAVDAATGTEEWTFDVPVMYQPTMVDGTIYIGSNDTELYALTASTETEVGGKQRPEKINEFEPGAEQIPSIEEMRSPKRCNLSYEDIQTIETINEGGQAVIKKAHLTDTKAPPEMVAIRQPPMSKTLTTEAVEEFLKHAKIWETIDTRERDKRRWRDSEHIVGVIDTGNDPFPWIAMEYMDGGDVGELLEEHPHGLPVGQALWIGECVCKGLKIADKLGKCHLDVKPENVLLKQTDGWPWPKLADWGLARNLAKETGPKQELSPEYAAPEQLDSDKFDDLDQLTDIYQTGALVYALLTGDSPMSEGSIPVPSEQRSSLSSEVDAAVGLALEREKLDRYDSIADFREALTAIRTGERLPREVARRVEE